MIKMKKIYLLRANILLFFILTFSFNINDSVVNAALSGINSRRVTIESVKNNAFLDLTGFSISAYTSYDLSQAKNNISRLELRNRPL